MYSVSSWFQVKLEDRSSEPIRQFLVGTSDYSDRVIKWPKIKRTSNSFRPVRPTINLDNADGNLNHFYETTIKMVQECYLKLGFAIPISTANLVGYWPLNETSGTNAPDESGNGNDGTLVNMEDADWVDGVVGKCLDFDDGDYVNIGNIASLNFGTENFSISAWAYLDSSTGDDYARIAGKKRIAAAAVGYSIYWRKSLQKLFWSTANGVDYQEYYSSNTIANGWHHIVMVRNSEDASIGYFYVDGVREEIAGSPTMIDVDTTDSFFIGGLGSSLSFINKIDEVRIYDKALTASEVKALYDNPGQEMVTLYTGNLKDVRYSDRACQIKTRDKLFDFTERKVGDSDTPVVFSETIPSDIAWTLCSCYGGLCDSKSTGNDDIDYTVFNAWASQFSADSILVNAYYDGLKVTEALTRLCKMTDSVSWVEGDGKVNFRKFVEPGSHDITLTRDEYSDILIDVEQLRITNKAYVYWDYDINSEYWTKTCLSQESTSVNSFGLHEDMWKDETVWYVNSVGALNFAQRQTMLLKDPPKSFKVDTDLYAMRQQLGETIRLVDSFYNITSMSGWRLSEYELNMETGEVKLEMDEALTANAFYLDVSLLDGDEFLL